MRTWKNRYWSAVKKQPLMIVLPLLLLALMSFGSFHTYTSFKQQLGLDNQMLSIELFAQFFGNVSTFAFFVIAVSVVLLWQWLMVDELYDRVLIYLPVDSSSWRLGLLVPLLSLFTLFISFLIGPIVYLFFSHVEIPLGWMALLIIFFTFLLAQAVLLGLCIQQLTVAISHWISEPSATSFTKKTIQMLSFLTLVLVGGLIGFVSFEFNLGVNQYLPGGLYQFLLAGSERAAYSLFLGLSGFLGYGFLLTGGLLVLYRIKTPHDSSLPNRSFWSSLGVLAKPTFSLFLVTLKRSGRDVHTAFYTLLSISLFFLLALSIRISGWEMYNGLVHELFIYMVPILLAIYPNQAFSKERGWTEYRLSLPFQASVLIRGHLLFYVGVLTVITLLLHAGFSLLLVRDGQFGLTGIYSATLYICAYLIGSIFPAKLEKAGSNLQQLILLYIAAGTVLFVYHSFSLSMIYYVIGLVLFLIVSSKILISRQKREVLV
ncbi:hypothetical protein E2R51_09060 [Jeotgalibacillus sp. S-D1]|uniref:hypothetical protein n=1 Tax=Jeotgalibacillus sp. S-D1 TaxID=2552189 RepID=UPI0010593FA1|nr:hypothetical protein [Jeotgalibacillus sp. S-D1]TDL32809.1 hypothetical protein E2R51_09060 [Jeotgalibacillus sp. S-D1]